MIIEHIGIVKIVKDKQEEYEHIYEAFRYDDTNYSIFFTNHKYLFNINLNYPKIRITLVLMHRIVDNKMICEQ